MIYISSTHRRVSIFQSFDTARVLLLMKSRRHLSQRHSDLNLAAQDEIHNKNFYTRIVRTRGYRLKEEKKKILKIERAKNENGTEYTARVRGYPGSQYTLSRIPRLLTGRLCTTAVRDMVGLVCIFSFTLTLCTGINIKPLYKTLV